MISPSIKSLLLVGVLAPLAIAQGYYDEFWFNPTNNRSCPGTVSTRNYWCIAPAVCTHDRLLNKYYCCASGVTGGVCRTSQSNCSSSGTQRCGTGPDSWCCLGSNAEQCAQRTNVESVCWTASTIANPFANISSDVLNEVYSSLTSLTAAATTTVDRLSFNYSSLVAVAATAAPVTTTGSSGSDSNGTTSPAPSSSTSASSGLSGGAIAGVVIGALAALAFLLLAVLLILRRRRRRQRESGTPTTSNAPESNTLGGPAAEAEGQGLHEKSADSNKTIGKAELRSSSERFEVPGSIGSPPPPFAQSQRAPVELATSNY